MNKILYVVLYIIIINTLQMLDAATTIYSVRNYPGVEANPLIDVTSFSTIFFNPIFILPMIICSWIIYFCESNKERAGKLVRSKYSFWISFPYILLVIKVLPVINNGMGIAGLSTPLAWLSVFSDNMFFLIIMSATIVSMLSSPVVSRYLKNRYPSNPSLK